ncbi:MAG: heparinase, partial [Acidimicrobiia bacterium]
MTPDQVRWYVERARRMSPGDAMTRVRDQARQRAWQRRRVRPGQTVAPVQARRPRPFPTTLDLALASEVPAPARAALVAAAERLRNGHWDTFGIERRDLVAPDWFLDPVT